MSTQKQWKDQIALVTGASSGIGTAIAERLVERGMRVALVARREERLSALAQRLDPAGTQTWVHAADLRKEDEIERMFEALRAHWGGADVLINNAGLGHPAPLLDGSAQHWKEMWEVNVLALALCTQRAVEDMRRRGDQGYVINISSMSGHRVKGGSMYSATKHAVRALTEGLRLELFEQKSRVRVTAISPGFVETGFHEVWTGKADHDVYSRFKVLEARDIADAVDYVLSVPPHVQPHDILLRTIEQAT